jgi:hypothetical protein
MFETTLAYANGERPYVPLAAFVLGKKEGQPSKMMAGKTLKHFH